MVGVHRSQRLVYRLSTIPAPELVILTCQQSGRMVPGRERALASFAVQSHRECGARSSIQQL
jgi:hypothetical protein